MSFKSKADRRAVLPASLIEGGPIVVRIDLDQLIRAAVCNEQRSITARIAITTRDYCRQFETAAPSAPIVVCEYTAKTKE